MQQAIKMLAGLRAVFRFQSRAILSVWSANCTRGLAKALCIFCLTAGAGLALAGPRIETWRQDSGAQVWFIQTPSLPMVDIQIDWDAGSRRDPQGQEGLAQAVATMLTRANLSWQGRPALSEEQLGSAWADLGAVFSAQASADRLSVSLRSLTRQSVLEEAVVLAAQQLAAAHVDETIWQRVQRNRMSQLKEAKTRPDFIAQQKFNAAVFGPHPYGVGPTEDSLAAISAPAIARMLDESVRACDAKVSVVGALERAQVDRIIGLLFSGVRHKACTARPPVPPVTSLLQPARHVLEFDSAQAHILIGQPGIARSDARYFPIIVGNYILGGGGFVSRLTKAVREKRGLSYSVYSAFVPALDRGEFVVSLQTRPDQAWQAHDVAKHVVQEFVQQGPTSKELQAAKDFMIGGFALNLDSNRKLLHNLAGIAWNNLPLNYLDTWKQEVERVSARDIQKAFQSVLQPENMVSVVVGARDDGAEGGGNVGVDSTEKAAPAPAP